MTRHVHPCPECYEHPVCPYYSCTIYPDLQREDGTPSGSFVVCSGCTERLLQKRDEETVNRVTRWCPAFEDIERDTPATIVLPGVKCRFCGLRWRDEIEPASLPGQKFMSMRGPKSCSMCEPSSAVDRKVFDFYPFYVPATIVEVTDDVVAAMRPSGAIDGRKWKPMSALLVRDERSEANELVQDPVRASWWFRLADQYPMRSGQFTHARLIVGYRLGET